MSRPVKVIEAAPEVISTVEITPSVESYLYVPDRACIEGAANPRVRSLLFALLLIAPQTIAQLRREARRTAP